MYVVLHRITSSVRTETYSSHKILIAYIRTNHTRARNKLRIGIDVDAVLYMLLFFVSNRKKPQMQN